MNRPVSIHEAAEAELNEAASYYERESCGLGVAFLEEVRQGIDHVSRFPEADENKQGAPETRSAFSIYLGRVD